MTAIPRRIFARAALAAACLLSGLPQVSAEPAGASVAEAEAAVPVCFESRQKDPAAAVALARRHLDGATLPPALEVKLRSCLARGAAVSGEAALARAAAERIDVLVRSGELSPEDQLRALSNAGATLHLLGDVNRALDLYVRAFEVARDEDVAEGQVAMLGNVGSIHSDELGAFAEAETFYAQAREIADTAGLPHPVLDYNRALNHLRLGDVDAAAAGFRASQAAAARDDSRIVALRAEAEIAAIAARRDPAITLSELRALADAQVALPDPSGASTTHVRISQVALARGDAATALSAARDALALVGPTQYRAEHRDALQARGEAQRATGDLAGALESMEALRALQIAVLRGQNLAGLAGLQARLESAAHAQSLARLQEERRVQALNVAHERRLRNLAIGAAVLVILVAGGFFIHLRRVNHRLRRLGTVDAMTGLANRRAATHRLRLMPPAGGDRRNAVFVIDVDHFKASNDRHGHVVGDAVLIEISRRLVAACRPGDIVARWGGEEFLVACPALAQDDAVAVAERLRTAISASTFVHDGADLGGQSISIGFSVWPVFADGETGRDAWQDAVNLADRALYASKRGGRDAWTGLWGANAGDATIAELLRDPRAAIAAGAARSVSSRDPVEWEPQSDA